MLLTFPLHSQAEEESSTQTKDIQKSTGNDEAGKNIENDVFIHFNKNADKEDRTIKSTLIIEAIKKGAKTIDIKNAIITGYLDFHIKENLLDIEESGIEVDEINKLKGRGIDKVYLISPAIYITNCQLQGNLEAGYDDNLKSIVIFESNVSFLSSKFLKGAYFRRASFNGEADFWKAIFNGEADFWEASFNGEASFMGKSASFLDAIFNGEAYFTRASFKEAASFLRASFKEKAHFEGASFNGHASFVGLSFNGETYFLQASFKYQASFRKASFKEKADFRGASFNGEADFEEASFNETASFGQASFNGETNLRGASFNETVQFYDTTISSKFVDLRLTRYPEFQITWSMLEGRLDNILLLKDITSWQGVYFRLIKNFKDIGDTKSADDAYYHYRYTKYLFCNDWWEKTKWWFGYLFMGLTCGYGVIPWRTIATAGGLIVIFTFCIYFPFSKRGSLELKGEYITKQEWYRRLYNCFYFSVIIFTTVGLGDIKPKGGFKAWAIAEGLLGWLTMALFLVTLANVWLR